MMMIFIKKISSLRTANFHNSKKGGGNVEQTNFRIEFGEKNQIKSIGYILRVFID